MSVLDSFSKEQRDLLVALPYRVGLWVGASDDSGGDDANAEEMKALSQIVTGYIEDYLKSQFVQTMMEETVSLENEWPKWDVYLDDVPEECRYAVQILAERIDRKELASFKLVLMEIGTAVAMAYREIDETDGVQSRLAVYGRIFMDKFNVLFGNGPIHSLDEILNISRAEKNALDELAKALDLANKNAGLEPIDPLTQM